MDFNSELHVNQSFINLELLAKQVVEGFISGMHKSPFHGFSAEFAEHKIYNSGESTRHIDWKLFAKTDKLFTKRFDEETNLRCHFILDNSSSMHYPEMKSQSVDHLNKVGFSALAIASLMHILKRQRDAVGMSIYSDAYDYYAPEKGSDRHHRMLLNKLDETIKVVPKARSTKTYHYLHQIAENIHRRSLVVLFTDMFASHLDEGALINALRHLKHNKHDVVLFHVFDAEKEQRFEFDNTPRRFVDLETGDSVNLYADNIKENYKIAVSQYFDTLKVKCGQYGITYVNADINEGFSKILLQFMIKRQQFV